MCLLGHDVALSRRLTFEDLIPQSVMIPGPLVPPLFTRIGYGHTEGVYFNFTAFIKSKLRLMCFLT